MLLYIFGFTQESCPYTDFYNGYCSRFRLYSVSFQQRRKCLGNMLKCAEVRWTLIWWRSTLSLGSMLGRRWWDRWPECRGSAEERQPGPSQSDHAFKSRRRRTFLQTHFGHSWLRLKSIRWKRHYDIYCIRTWCLLIENTQSSFEPA